MCVQSETDEEMMSNDGIDDAMTIETVGGNSQLKKGPWTSAEDAILDAYVKEHGEGNWNAVQRNTGLARCGKSCRLRWSNHLRPDLKKGAFTPEEEHLIIELHHKMGNKWAQMAAKMPGRTDNEIKNYWNTRIKRQQRAGLPLYPPEISLQALDENQQTDNASSFSSMDAHSQDVMQVNNTFDIPEIQFKNLELDHHHVYAPPFLDIPLLPILHSPYPKTPPTPDPLQGSESIFSSATMSSDTTYQSGGYVQSDQPFMYSSAYDQSGSYAVLNGNSSAPSEPDWGPEEELPSLQTQAAYNWCSLPSSPLPSLDCDAVLHESQTTDHLTDSSDFLDMVFDSFSSELIHEAGWEPFGELTSSVGLSAPSLFNEGTVSEPAEAIAGSRAQEEAAIWAPPEYISKDDMTNQIFSQSGSRSI